MRGAILGLIVVFCTACFTLNCDVPNASKVDCGYDGITQGQCQAKGCCWQPEGQGSSIPWCFYSASHTLSCNLVLNSTGVPPFTEAEFSTMMDFMLKNVNIDGKGGIVASPDKNVPAGGSYYYHWERDAAISVRALLIINGLNTSSIDADIQAYIQWVLHVQNEGDPHGIDVRTEPKYLLPDGQVYPGGWCRPQTDGPGLRSLGLIDYANALGQQGQSEYVKKYLWTGSDSTYNGGVIKYDLEWIAANWTSSGCDLWENVRSTDFFWNRFTFKHALLRGSKFASKMGDSSSAAKYASVAQTISATLMNHYNQQEGYVYESTNRPVDAAVIVAFNEGYEDELIFTPTSEMVLGTIKYLNDFFCDAFPINVADTKKGINGILYGRFKGDNYPDAGGNPWVLTTAALAELFYRGATYTLENGLPDEKAVAVWRGMLGKHDDRPSLFDFARSLAQAGDGVLERLKYHVQDKQFHLYEQISKTTGEQMSAYDLTWSYGTTLKACAFRDNYVKTALRRFPEKSRNDASFFSTIITQ